MYVIRVYIGDNAQTFSTVNERTAAKIGNYLNSVGVAWGCQYWEHRKWLKLKLQ